MSTWCPAWPAIADVVRQYCAAKQIIMRPGGLRRILTSKGALRPFPTIHTLEEKSPAKFGGAEGGGT